MIATVGIDVPQVSLRDAASLGAVQRLAWAMGRPPAAPAAPAPAPSTPASTVASVVVLKAARRARAAEALRRLAADPAATPAERALAAERATQFGRRSA
ncbi:hypothetical protein [Nocardioides sp. Kera G14]|uniref:hypothetical protein n=1 Tax=Nocardioides sp. Kera G14 TaxID=2884264 RepID=UPI001D129B5F|nr:hypothetical protein [Nocardioides sp. Kera G14]UDY25157.1 hypothetical protein LH076_07675 [Nocardioides sp. Kera G14]